MALARKTNPQAGRNAVKRQVIKVNPYENPENVMELMAKISSATASADMDQFGERLDTAFCQEIEGMSLSDYLPQYRSLLLNGDFLADLRTLCKNLSITLGAHENTKHTQIVVAGGFSSGKSSFLNRLTNSANLLPTGVEPVSVVKTYLYCSGNNRSVSVRGVNLKNVLVDLEPGVLQAIQHAKQSHVFLASVLEKLFVEIPSKDLDGLVFIDTPGYNNSDRANQSNGKTDRETAMEALSEGNVLFWLVDCERGTTVADDIEMIKQFEGKKVIIFNKADKKGKQEAVQIVNNAARTLLQEFPEDIIDILALSTLDNMIYYSYNKKTMGQIIQEAKQSGNGDNGNMLWRNAIEDIFDQEIGACEVTIQSLKKEYKEELLPEKEECHTDYQNSKEISDIQIKELREVCQESYTEVFNTMKKYEDSNYFALNQFSEFIGEMYAWDNTEHTCWENTLTPKINEGARQNKFGWNRYNAINYEYYEADYRKELVDWFESMEQQRIEFFENSYNKACQDCEDNLERQQAEKEMHQRMSAYKNLFMKALDEAIRTYQRQNKAKKVYDDAYVVPNVFESIQKEDYKAFLRSFENGVDLAVCNPNGYSPLTLAVQMGNNEMVKFMLDHDADPSIKDRRGYNAFHTAVENQYRDICKMLLDADPDLIATKTEKGETIEELARKQTFSKWIEQEIKNAF
ncbi:hypothetical protein EII14_05080 [Alloprevotella sp. OH1205_COT-284]|uniref:dynamin family protein n=1 Tax=Alloprevotella sp. OH1205_COT-284 TaxID=2491043 RepID=UPI000F5EE894|nr:dynamin family protein [Alloprevotella sp. OH1205_COT-284]RRD79813.1 hypothetical protein EII14_05080 [Alloprevotella sp. OH1205_COT-284]